MSKKLHPIVISFLMSFLTIPSVFGQTTFEVQADPAADKMMRTTGTSLRSAEQTAWPDSVLVFRPDGRKASKNLFFYDKANNLIRRENWDYRDNGEVTESQRYIYTYDQDIITTTHYFSYNGVMPENPVSVSRKHKTKKVLPYYDADEKRVYLYSHFLVRNVAGDGYEETYDSRGNLISMITLNEKYKIYKIDISYDERNNPVMIEWKDADENDAIYVAPYKEVYQWDTRGNIVYYEEWRPENGELKLDLSWSYKFTYDSYGNETRIVEDYKNVEILHTPGITPQVQNYRWKNNSWVLESYEVYYPQTSSSLESNNNEAVGDDNKGSFDIIVNIPADSLAGGSFEINLPDGFMLDADNTKLTVDFDQFELVITKQEGNAWKLEIKTKTLKSALPLSTKASTVLANIVYVVDEKVKEGEYDIAVKNIQFTTPVGNPIFEPEMTVPVLLDRTATGIDAIHISEVKIFSDGDALVIDSPLDETIDVYSITGARIYHGTKPAGKITVQIPGLPGKMMVVKGGSNWVKKVMTK